MKTQSIFGGVNNGKSEYDTDTLQNEYLRDKSEGLAIQLPQNYFPQMQPPAQQMPIGQNAAQPQGPQDDRIWVASESAAEAFLVAANGFVRLWDSNKPVFYEKRADMNGRPMPLVAYEYKIRDSGNTPEAVNAGFEQRLAAVEEKIKQMTEGKHNDA